MSGGGATARSSHSGCEPPRGPPPPRAARARPRALRPPPPAGSANRRRFRPQKAQAQPPSRQTLPNSPVIPPLCTRRDSNPQALRRRNLNPEGLVAAGRSWAKGSDSPSRLWTKGDLSRPRPPFQRPIPPFPRPHLPTIFWSVLEPSSRRRSREETVGQRMRFAPR
jgi:hypothetical protein